MREVFCLLCLKPAHNATAVLLQALAALNIEDLIIVINDAFALAHADGRLQADLADIRQASQTG